MLYVAYFQPQSDILTRQQRMCQVFLALLSRWTIWLTISDTIKIAPAWQLACVCQRYCENYCKPLEILHWWNYKVCIEVGRYEQRVYFIAFIMVEIRINIWTTILVHYGPRVIRQTWIALTLTFKMTLGKVYLTCRHICFLHIPRN